MGRLIDDRATPSAPDASSVVPSGSADGGGRRDIERLARGGALNLAGTITYGVLNFLLVVIVTRGMGKEGAGAFFEAVALFIIASNTAELGADTGLLRFISRYKALGRAHELRALLKIAMVPALVAGTVLAALGWVFARPLAAIFSAGQTPETLVPYIHLLVVFLPLSCVYTVAVAGTRGFGTMVPAVVVDRMGVPTGQNAMALVAVLSGLASTALALAYGVPIGLGFVAIVSWLMVLERRTVRRLPDEVSVTPTRALAKEFWSFTAPRGLAGVFQVAILWLDTLLLGAMKGAGAAAVYTASSRYIVVGQALLIAVTQAIAPQISSLLASEEHERARDVYQTATAWLTTLAWPVYLTMAVFSPVLVAVFGKAFGAGAPVLTILSVAMLLSMAVGPVDVVLLMGGKSWWSLANTAAALVVNVGLNLLLIPKFGLEGAAVAWFISIVLRNTLPLFQVWRFLRLEPFGPGFKVAALASVGCYLGIALAVRAVLGETFLALLVAGALATAVYSYIVWRNRETLRLLELAAAMRRRRNRQATAGV